MIIFQKRQEIQVSLNVTLTCSLTCFCEWQTPHHELHTVLFYMSHLHEPTQSCRSPRRQTLLFSVPFYPQEGVITPEPSEQHTGEAPCPRALHPLTPLRCWALCQVLGIKCWARSALPSRSFESSGKAESSMMDSHLTSSPEMQWG